jgi:hypothetical protein
MDIHVPLVHCEVTQLPFQLGSSSDLHLEAKGIGQSKRRYRTVTRATHGILSELQLLQPFLHPLSFFADSGKYG